MASGATRKKSGGISQKLAEFPRKHLYIASALILTIFVSLTVIPSNEAEAKRTSQELVLNIEPSLELIPESETITEERSWQYFKVKNGDSLSTIFKRAGVSATTLHKLINSSPEAKKLQRIFPGQTLAFDISADNELLAVKHVQNKLESTLFERSKTEEKIQYTVKQIAREPEMVQRYSSATITSSLYLAADRAGLHQSSTMELANIFGGVIDFVYDVRAGDNFSILYEERYLDGEKLGPGPILAAEFTNRGETYTAYRYIDENGDIGYYTIDGVSMRKAFLRAPLDFTRISSNFNLRRLHPISKVRRPHRGIDYAAPRGTPVYAAGDGRVLKSGFTKANGNYIVLSHGTEYQTKYLHLHKRAVKRGQKVKQRQIIGWVGSTGFSTGPHLHYEFLVNGVHRNPRTILNKLPKAKSLAKSEHDRFHAQIKGVKMQLATYNNNRKLALAEQANNSSL